MKDVEKDFKEYIKSQELSKSTKKTTLYNIEVFYKFCKSHNITKENLNKNHILEYVEHIQSFSNNTQLSCIQALRKLMKCIDKSNLMDGVSISRDYSAKPNTKTLSDMELKKLLDYLSKATNDTPIIIEKIRDCLIVKIILACKNMNNNEILKLKFSDFTLKDDKYTINCNGKKSYINANFIHKELELLKEKANYEDGYIFTSKLYKKPISVISFRYNILEIGKNIGIDKLVSGDIKRTIFNI